MTTRRGFITGLISLVAAPAIVRASSLMPVKVLPPDDLLDLLKRRIADVEAEAFRNIRNNLYGELTEITQKSFVPRLMEQVHDQTPILQVLRQHHRHSVWATEITVQ